MHVDHHASRTPRYAQRLDPLLPAARRGPGHVRPAGQGSEHPLAPPSCKSWRRILDQLDKRSDLAGLVIQSGKPGTFIAGADIREFVASLGTPKSEVVAMCRRGQSLFQRLSQWPFVTVAAIDGICVGGGAELAVWCDRRVMSRQSENRNRLSRSEAGPLSRLGRHGAGAADRRPGERRRNDYRRRNDRCRRGAARWAWPAMWCPPTSCSTRRLA